MPRGTPDGRIESQQFAAQVSDVAHVNNMLWGFSPINGTGRVLYFETFNNGLNGWGKTQTGAALVPALASPASYVYSPPNCAVLNSGVTANDLSKIYREMYAGKSLRVSIEMGTNFSAGVQPRFSIDYKPIGYNPFFGAIRFSQSAGAWQVLTNGPTWNSFYVPGAPPGAQGMLIQIKLVMDFSTGNYVTAFIGDQDFDLSAYIMFTSSSAYTGLLIAEVRHDSKGAGATALQVGYVLVAKDEP